MKRYALGLTGTTFEKTVFVIAFTIACFSVVFLPLGLIFLITNVEIKEIPY